MNKNFGFLAVNVKEVTSCIVYMIDKLKSLNKNYDISLFSNAHCSNQLQVGVFGSAEMWYFNGTLFVFTDKDVEYAINLKNTINIVFVFIRQKINIINMFKCMSKHNVRIIILDESDININHDCYRLLGVSPSKLEDVL